MMPDAPLTFRRNDFDYRLLKQCCTFALYEQSKRGSVVGYEVHKLRFLKERAVKFGNVVKTLGFRVRLPCNEDFGTYGWSFVSLVAAEQKLAELIEKDSGGSLNKHGGLRL